MSDLISNEYKFVDIILPSFEEHETVALCVKRVIETVGEKFSDFRIIVVIDGPDLQAVKALSELQCDTLVVIQLQDNYGKGYALKQGIFYSNAKYVVFLDADLDIHPITINYGIGLMEVNTSLFATYGSKMHPDSNVNYPFVRRCMSMAFRIFTRFFINIDVEDTQTGIKVFRSSNLKEVVLQSSENGFLFDLEVLMLMSDLDAKFESLPVDLDYQFNSSIKPTSAIRMIVQLIALRRRVSHREM